MTNNFNLIRDYLMLPKDNKKGTNDIYYTIEVLKRGKDNPDIKGANFHFKNYYVYSLEDYDKYKDEIIAICTLLNMRAYISVNYKSTKQVMLNCAAEITNRIANHDYKKPQSIIESCSAKYVDKNNKRYVIDIDNVDNILNANNFSHQDLLFELMTIVNSCRNDKRLSQKVDNPTYFQNPLIFDYDNLIAIIPTKTGLHLITYGFYKDEFINKYNESIGKKLKEEDKIKYSDIKENHLTLLYENIGKRLV